ncbi:polysaccharide deacetylase family protein [Lachnoclostridium phytofermentans]|uniref:Polysaccharide deacetylase n=1 Tax=Lachnoclostridium phytofermentans (strain ATCC 700394 / DSM 18823 / ISDg) TaxID=357809 RepID=A9KHC5_LACP7|nr:polysaccharide deacetylase family protein [Lachnoclostridium phytofermentans]ABX40792.1 polysaccharide deacetylase [Lachnoclostridium phytofermentans ISDg]
MSVGYLTMDDGPSDITRDIIDYLTGRGIKPVFFFTGQNIEKRMEEGVYAIKKGAIIGNHSYSHPNFEQLTLEQCISEVEKTEELINELYKKAGEVRKFKLFRFPYGARKLNESKEFQEYLKNQRFCKLDDMHITSEWYDREGLIEGVDVLWTYDFTEYRIQNDTSLTYDDLVARIHEKKQGSSDSLLNEGSRHIVLLHDHEETNAVISRYYQKFLDYVMLHGVDFIEPEFRYLS